MSMKNTDKKYWNERYIANETGWDIGHISTPIKDYIDQLTNQNLDILIPGCGNSYEGEYLINQGFENTHLIDFSEEAITNFKKRVPQFPSTKIYQEDFFQHNKKYDLIIEQTFFSAIHPTQRNNYVEKMHAILKPKGKLTGLLFGIELFTDHPPYGGDLDEYQKLFSPYFSIKVLETAHNSIPPRQGNELFLILEKK